MAPAQVSHHASISSSPSSYKAVWFNKIGNGRVADASIPHHLGKMWSLDHLSSELLALIFKQLRDVDSASLAGARLLSRRFNAILTPIKYEYLRLNERIIAPQAQVYLPDALENVYTHTRHVHVRSDLDPEGIKRLLDRLRRPLSISWSYVGGGFRSGMFWVPSDVLSPHHMLVGRTKLYIEGLPLRDFNGQLQDTYLKAIPSNMLVSLKMAKPGPPLTNRLESLKRLLLSSRNLETFHYQDRGQGTRFTFSQGEQLPGFKELVLQSYDWNHSTEDVRDHWDFSRIRHLKLVDVPIYEFIVSIPFSSLVDLHTLHCEDYSAHLIDRREEATVGLYALVRQIHALRALKITCHTRLFPVDAILFHARSLEVLRFCDHVGFADESLRCPTMWIEDLDLLAQNLVHVHTLELDMDVAFCDPPLFLRALCSFPRLHTLTLHVQTVLHAFEVVYPDVDRDYEATAVTLESLMRMKVGEPWRCITIKIGGWKRHMVRRLGEAWRAQNELGVYAERCFVLERDPSGRMGIREEIPICG